MLFQWIKLYSKSRLYILYSAECGQSRHCSYIVLKGFCHLYSTTQSILKKHSQRNFNSKILEQKSLKCQQIKQIFKLWSLFMNPWNVTVGVRCNVIVSHVRWQGHGIPKMLGSGADQPSCLTLESYLTSPCQVVTGEETSPQHLSRSHSFSSKYQTTIWLQDFI